VKLRRGPRKKNDKEDAKGIDISRTPASKEGSKEKKKEDRHVEK